MAINKFGVTAVRNAWYDSKQVTDHVVQGYTKVMFLCFSGLFISCCIGMLLNVGNCVKKTASKSQGMGQSSGGIHGGYINR